VLKKEEKKTFIKESISEKSSSQRAFQKHVLVVFSNKEEQLIAPCKVAAQLLCLAVQLQFYRYAERRKVHGLES